MRARALCDVTLFVCVCVCVYVRNMYVHEVCVLVIHTCKLESHVYFTYKVSSLNNLYNDIVEEFALSNLTLI